MFKKIVFIDRDGTIIDEPADQQVDAVSKFKFKANVIPALLKLIQAGFTLVMVTNQDGLGTVKFPKTNFTIVQDLLINILASQGIDFADILICPHFSSDQCQCRKPKLGLVQNYLRSDKINFAQSYVIGDRQTDLQLAENMGITGVLYNDTKGWHTIVNDIINAPRSAVVQRKTKETTINVSVNLDESCHIKIHTGIGFFDHMLEQLAKHADIGVFLEVKGDLHIDEHHTVEDTAIALGEALRQALGDKLGINRYGFLLAMDEALAHLAIDLSGRGIFVFDGNFTRDKIGEFPTELVSHFFQSLAQSLAAALHIKVSGENNHHKIESIFKGFGRTLKQAIQQQGFSLPSTKGVL